MLLIEREIQIKQKERKIEKQRKKVRNKESKK